MIVFPHGGPHVRDILEFNTITQFFATRDFAVLEVNYRGSASYGGSYRYSALLGNLATLLWTTLPMERFSSSTKAPPSATGSPFSVAAA